MAKIGNLILPTISIKSAKQWTSIQISIVINLKLIKINMLIFNVLQPTRVQLFMACKEILLS